MPKTATQDRRLVRLELTEEEHQAVRIAAARRGVSMAALARESVVEAARRINAKGEK